MSRSERSRFPARTVNAVVALVATLLLATGVEAQQTPVELIVRISDSAPAELRAVLDAGVPPDGARARLFSGVQSSRKAFGERAVGRPAAGEWADQVYILTLSDSTALAAALAAWAADGAVVYAQPNGRYALDDVADLDDEPFADSLGHLRVTRVDEAWATTTGSPSIRVGVIDTGLFFEHPDFAGQVWTNPGEVPGNGVDDDGNGYVDDVRGYDFVDRAVSVDAGDFYTRDPDASEDGRQMHGTLVAGVVSAALNGVGTAGVAPGARLVPLRAFGRDGVAEDDDLVAAIVYAADMQIEVVNLSFGRRQDSPLLHEAIRYAYSRGTVVIASGGNAGGDAPHYPSDYPEAIGAAWFTADGTGIEGFGGQYGPGIDVGAPGTQVFTTLMPLEGDPRPDSLRFYGRRSGSSFAAPQVAGAAALLLSVNPALTPEAVRGVLTATARDVNEPGWDHRTAAGLLDVASALGLPYPTNVSLTSPEMDGGTNADRVPLIGSAIAPQFENYSLQYAEYDDSAVGGESIGPWQPLAGPFTQQIREDTLAVWETSGLAERRYLIRLVAVLRTGQTLEDRRRVTLDRSAPVLDLGLIGPAYLDGRQGILAEVETDDFTTVRLEVTRSGQLLDEPIEAPERSRRHGLFWPNRRGETGFVTIRLIATNRAGLVTTTEQSVTLDVLPLNQALLTERPLDVPAGYLLEQAVDFDRDGLKDIVFNALRDGEPGDSVFVYEWGGTNTFRQLGFYNTNLIPRDVGDTDGDGRLELLLQAGTYTFLLEAEGQAATCAAINPDTCFPGTLVFADTTASGSPRRPLWGAQLADLDGDGRGEILGHDLRIRADENQQPFATQWRVLEWNGTTWAEVASLANPTAASDPEEPVNLFSEPRALVGDFDGDGRGDFVAGDADGDFILYEATGNDTYAPVWTYETDRTGAGSRLVAGDFDGDGTEEFWGFTSPRVNGLEGETRFGVAQLFDATGDNQLLVRQTLLFEGFATRYGSFAAADLNSDGTDELVAIHPPDLWVFSAAADWKPIFHAGAAMGADLPTGLRSIRTVAADFSGDGTPELVASGADGQMRLFTYNAAQAALPPPNLTEAVARGVDQVHLAWTSSADSVTVYAAFPGEAFTPVVTTSSDSLNVPVSITRDYALRAWFGGVLSDLSDPRRVRPHAPAVVTAVTYPSAGYVRLQFSERLDAATTSTQFRLANGSVPASLLLESDGFAAVLRFDPAPRGAATLLWTNLRDAEGSPVDASSVDILFPDAADEGTLLLVEWRVLDTERVVLTFSEPLDPGAARTVTNYRVDPLGTIAAATFLAERPAEVELTIDGQALGATGLRTTVIVEAMTAASGATLAPEGNVATFSTFATDLSDVYVFPNPYREGEHQPRVMIAGLPREATLQILSLGGERVRQIEEFDGDGGAAWDLTDDSGARVPSGIYLVRIAAEGMDPVIRKIAVVR